MTQIILLINIYEYKNSHLQISSKLKEMGKIVVHGHMLHYQTQKPQMGTLKYIKNIG